LKIFEKQEFPELSTAYKAALLPVAVALSVVIPMIVVTTLRIPLFLDMTGIVLVSMIAGPVWAFGTACLQVFVRVLLNGPIAATGILTSGVGALFFGTMVKYGMAKSWKRIAVLMVAFAFILSVCSATTRTFVYGGFTGDPADILIAGMVKVTGTIWTSVLTVDFLRSIVDKCVVTAMVVSILRGLPPRFRKLTPIAAKEAPVTPAK
jgi:predicted membrane protein